MTGPRRGFGSRWQELASWRAPLRREIKRVRRLDGRLRQDLAKAATAAELRTAGEALKSRLHELPSGASEVTLEVPWLGETIVVHLRPDLSPRANMERLFRRARGFARAEPRIRERMRANRERLDRLAALAERLQDALAVAPEPASSSGPAPLAVADSMPRPELLDALLSDLEASRLRLRLADPRAASALDRKRLGKGRRRLPAGIHGFRTARGAEVLAGRSAAANDLLITRLARGRDIWFHPRDRPGAHLLLRMRRKDDHPDPRDLLDCAILVAHLSGVAKGDRAEVSWTRAKHVRKPARAAPGAVLIAAEKSLLVTVDRAVVDGFYARRERLGAG